MELIHTYTITRLTETCVNIIIKDFDKDTNELIGLQKRVCFNNIPYDRNRIQIRLPQDVLDEIFAVWGDTPIANDPSTNIND